MRLFKTKSIDQSDDAISRVGLGAFVLDVREVDEFAAGHIPNAMNIPLGELDERKGELPVETELIVVCRSGARSSRAVKHLAQIGVKATNLSGGMQQWSKEQREVVSDSELPGKVI